MSAVAAQLAAQRAAKVEIVTLLLEYGAEPDTTIARPSQLFLWLVIIDIRVFIN